LYPFTRDMTLELAYAKVNNDGLMIEEKTFTDNQLELAMQTNKEATRIDLIAGYIFEGGRHFYSKDEKSIIYYLADVPGYPCIELASLKLPYYADEKYPDIDLQRDFNKIGKNRTGYSLNILIKTIKDDKKRTGICIPLLLDTRYTTVSDLKNSFSYLLGNPNFRLKGHILKVDYRLGGTKVNLIDSYLTDQATEFGLKEALTQYNEEYINARRTNS